MRDHGVLAEGIDRRSVRLAHVRRMVKGQQRHFEPVLADVLLLVRPADGQPNNSQFKTTRNQDETDNEQGELAPRQPCHIATLR